MLPRTCRCLAMIGFLLALWADPANAHLDLDLRDVAVRRVSSCTSELRFKVKYRYAVGLHGHVGPASPLSYRIVVNAFDPAAGGVETTIWQMQVVDHAPGGTIPWVVPDGSRTVWDAQCRLQRYEEVVVRVDDRHEVPEANESNNVKEKHWRTPSPPLGGCFASPPERCK